MKGQLDAKIHPVLLRYIIMMFNDMNINSLLEKTQGSISSILKVSTVMIRTSEELSIGGKQGSKMNNTCIIEKK